MFLNFNPNCSLKWLEQGPHIYNKDTDSLYELDKEAAEFTINHQTIALEQDNGFSDTHSEFLNYCQQEKIYLTNARQIQARQFIPAHDPMIPSLRYLLVHITEKCNLECRHCYLGETQDRSMPIKTLMRLFSQMQAIQGLIVLISGGEPLCHPKFWDINAILPLFDLRFELLSNGVLIAQEAARKLNVHHVQISLDGMKTGHEFLRGDGSFKKTIQSIENLLNAGKEVSVSSMVYSKNLDEFESMAKLLQDFNIDQWIVNAPSSAGRWADNAGLSVPLDVAAEYMVKYSCGEGPHESKYNQTCGSHICTVLVDGNIHPCPFLLEEEMRMGNIDDGLFNSWQNKKGITIDLAECGDCEFKDICRGGCRFRAKEYGHLCGKDPVMCAIFKKRKEVTSDY